MGSAANLAAARAYSLNYEIIYRDKIDLAASQTWYPGDLVGWNTTSGSTQGYGVKFDQANANSGIILLGRYAPSIGGPATLNNSAGANGALQGEVELFKPHYLFWADITASANAPTIVYRGSPAYAESSHEIGILQGSWSRVGTIYRIGSSADSAVGLVAVDITGQV